MLKRGNLLSNPLDASSAEIMEKLSSLGGTGTTIERIASDGQSSPPDFWYDQDWDEWVAVLAGGAELEFDNPAAEERLSPGDWLLIPAHRRHRVRATLKGTLWLAVHGKAPLPEKA